MFVVASETSLLPGGQAVARSTGLRRRPASSGQPGSAGRSGVYFRMLMVIWNRFAGH